MDINTTFPAQRIPFKSKGEKWRRDCVDWAVNSTYFNYSPVRQDVVQMKINYDLINGVVHMQDVARIINPDNLSTMFLPDKIQHYPIINSKLNTLRGEEAARVFDWRVIVTNPYAISQIEEDKKNEFYSSTQSIVEDTDSEEEEAMKQVKDQQNYFQYDWQDIREIRGNELLRHYSKEQNWKQLFNDGFVDAMTVSTEVYQCGIVGGEPMIVRMNPMKLRIFRSGYSNRIEDADMIVYEDYWSRGKILDTYYDDLSAKDVKWLSDEIPDYEGSGPLGAAGNEDPRYGFIPAHNIVGEDGVWVDNDGLLGSVFDGLAGYDGGIGSNLLPYDVAGNIRVVRVWWKSQRKIYKVKSFDPVTGEEVFDFYPETYIPNKDAGEEATALWVNEAWEGTKIG